MVSCISDILAEKINCLLQLFDMFQHIYDFSFTGIERISSLCYIPTYYRQRHLCLEFSCILIYFEGLYQCISSQI